MDFRNAFGSFASAVNAFASSPAATGLAFIVVIVWAAFGPAAHYSSNWQLIINTGTTIITFLMVFLLNNAQSRDTKAVNVKLDTIIAALERADNRVIGMEQLSPAKAEAVIEDVGQVIAREVEEATERAVEERKDAG